MMDGDPTFVLAAKTISRKHESRAWPFRMIFRINPQCKPANRVTFASRSEDPERMHLSAPTPF
jgi:hypothetical protein